MEGLDYRRGLQEAGDPAAARGVGLDHVQGARLFEGAPGPDEEGLLRPQLDRPGLGLSLRQKEAERYRIRGAAT
ncbi:MAG: hypothetical protein ACJ79V_10895 [Myxococcales bacterium]